MNPGNYPVMTAIFRCRVDPNVLKRAVKITEESGTSLPEIVRTFLTQIARTGTVPVSLSTRSKPSPLINKKARDKVLRSLDDTEAW
jgi:antitoxin component of RelBE/YafQ-DinJ toxin-antitoxin module